MTATNMFSVDGMTVNSPWIWRFLKSTPLVFHVFIAVAVTHTDTLWPSWYRPSRSAWWWDWEWLTSDKRQLLVGLKTAQHRHLLPMTPALRAPVAGTAVVGVTMETTSDVMWRQVAAGAGAVELLVSQRFSSWQRPVAITSTTRWCPERSFAAASRIHTSTAHTQLTDDNLTSNF